MANYATPSVLGSQTASEANYGQQKMTAPTPRTISSAVGRIDALNERLHKVREQLALISDQIGGPRDVNKATSGDNGAEASNAVSRLNGSADAAHECLSDIESLLGSIGRALG